MNQDINRLAVTGNGWFLNQDTVLVDSKIRSNIFLHRVTVLSQECAIGI